MAKKNGTRPANSGKLKGGFKKAKGFAFRNTEKPSNRGASRTAIGKRK